MNEHSFLALKFEQLLPSKAQATITVEKPYIATLYREILLKQKKDARIQGFSQGSVPISYLEKTFRIPILEHLQGFLLSSCILNYLFDQLAHNKVVMVGQPSLSSVIIDPEQPASFVFEFTTAPAKINNEWEKLSFRAPSRKNYRDLDKQVEFFFKEEAERTSKPLPDCISLDDWICFSVQPADAEQKSLLGDYKDILWMKVGDEETDEEAQQIFLGKKVGDSFITQATFLQDYVNNTFSSPYFFVVTIINRSPNQIFCFDSFKKHFKLKTARDLHLKFIEVFSYRHDVSQRRETVEATLKSLVRHHQFTIPEHLIMQQREILLKLVHLNPDYYVYKAQTDFKEKITMLAEKQLKELIVIDSLSYKENIQVTQDDIMGYINLMKRPRTKEFIYFSLTSTKTYGKEVPISQEVMRQQCLREKTLNYVINRLTKK